MPDSSAIIVAVISLVASVGAALTSWYTYHRENRESIRETSALLRKYRDPLLLSALELQARLYNIINGGILFFNEGTPEERDTLHIYTAFLFGQFFAWMHIIRRQGQFVAFVSEGKQRGRTRDFIRITELITEILNTTILVNIEDNALLQNMMAQFRLTDEVRTIKGRAKRCRLELDSSSTLRDEPEEHAELLVLWKDHQRAIGEIMTMKDYKDGELVCMDFIQFTKLWKENSPQKVWFETVSRAIDALASAAAATRTHTPLDESSTQGSVCPLAILRIRIRHLQHVLLALVDLLDENRLPWDAWSKRALEPGTYCPCNGGRICNRFSRQGRSPR